MAKAGGNTVEARQERMATHRDRYLKEWRTSAEALANAVKWHRIEPEEAESFLLQAETMQHNFFADLERSLRADVDEGDYDESAYERLWLDFVQAFLKARKLVQQGSSDRIERRNANYLGGPQDFRMIGREARQIFDLVLRSYQQKAQA